MFEKFSIEFEIQVKFSNKNRASLIECELDRSDDKRVSRRNSFRLDKLVQRKRLPGFRTPTTQSIRANFNGKLEVPSSSKRAKVTFAGPGECWLLVDFVLRFVDVRFSLFQLKSGWDKYANLVLPVLFYETRRGARSGNGKLRDRSRNTSPTNTKKNNRNKIKRATEKSWSVGRSRSL